MKNQFYDFNLDGSYSSTVAEIIEFTDELRLYLEESDTEERGGDELRLFFGIQQCREILETDDEAEAVR